MPAAKPWLETLTLNKLSRLATAIGAPCSGTKPARIDGINRAISSADLAGTKAESLSLLSIDMGIRNLAFAHITAPLRIEKNLLAPVQYGKPTLQAWRRIAVSHSSSGAGQPIADPSQSSPAGRRTNKTLADSMTLPKESFEPVDYAKHAYQLVKYLLQTYQPNQILIERQRFRSGGGSAVQEWTIRVGVFEGMLYAVLRTLMEIEKMKLLLDPMQPTQVNRFWLQHRLFPQSPSKIKLTGRDIKKAKVDTVLKLLGDRSTNIHVTAHLEPFIADFISSAKSPATGRRIVGEKISKLDDLADSILQGLAFISWQNNRERIKALGRDAIDIESGALL